jgi:isopenicillin-N N-acyltransferase-like protein
VHTNHFLSPRFTGRDVGLWLMPDSPFRLQSAQTHVRSRMGDVSPATLQEAFSLHADHPVGVCSHPREEVDVGEQEATVVSAVMDLTDAQMWIADGNPCTTGYRRMDYSDLLGGA